MTKIWCVLVVEDVTVAQVYSSHDISAQMTARNKRKHYTSVSTPVRNRQQCMPTAPEPGRETETDDCA